MQAMGARIGCKEDREWMRGGCMVNGGWVERDCPEQAKPELSSTIIQWKRTV